MNLSIVWGSVLTENQQHVGENGSSHHRPTIEDRPLGDTEGKEE